MSTPRPLLLTGFEPFLDVAVNPSGEVAALLDGEIWPPGVPVVGLRLPVSFERGPATLESALAGLPAPPLAILSLGVHRGASFRLERRAGARFRSTQPDNDGQVGEAVTLPGPQFREMRLNPAIADGWLEEAGAPETVISTDAGGYLCERVFRAGLDHSVSLGCLSLFLHVPPIESMGVSAQARVVRGFGQRLVEYGDSLSP